MYIEIAAAVQSVKTLADLVKAAHGLSNHVEIVTAVNAVQEKLTQALVSNLESVEKQTALANRVRELEQKIVKLENWDREIQRYLLKEIGAGVFAYSLKRGMDNGEPPHLLCANCVNNRKKSILQTKFNDEFGRIYVCHGCNSELRVDSGTSRRTRAGSDYDPLA